MGSAVLNATSRPLASRQHLPGLDGLRGLAILGGSYALTGILRIALGVPLCLAIAWVIWHGFEKHFLHLKRFFPARGQVRRIQNELSPGFAAIHPTAE
jgi:peptidoglycan/LPS O-acetylase OafA/YrhL